MSETIFRKVMCSDRLPENYQPKDLIQTSDGKYWFKDFHKLTGIRWWLEKVNIDSIKAEAWDEGYKKGERVGRISSKGNILVIDPTNPYKT